MAPPTGTITFLFSDIEGSSRLWERFPGAMGAALARHDAIVRAAMETNGGYVFKTVGDAFCVAFDTAADAVHAAAGAQRELCAEDWGETGALRVRMAIHIGAAELRGDDYFGTTLNRVARILAAAHGGQSLVSLAVQDLVRDQLPPGISLLDLGERRLRDLHRPERLFQAVIEGLPSEFPPLRSLEAVPNNLPTNLSSFVGREQELIEVRRQLGATRLLTLTGTGGTGKTRLAAQVAAEVLDDYPDGVWFVELAPIGDPDRVVETVASTLGLREEPETPIAATLIHFLHDRRLLLVIDNCEHVLAECARLATDLLRACPPLRILATSRHSLGISGERHWPVPPLTTIDPWKDLFQVPDVVARISQFEAVRLFIDRAESVKPGFEVTRQNAPAIAQICWRLDGIPLAIELAAARARVLSPEQIASRLDDRFRLLTGGNRSVPPHQQTLRTLIDWSYDLLSESERVLFRRLGAFGGGRTIEAIEAVCAGDGVDAYDALDLLDQLVDKSLLAVETAPDGESRYTMIESVWHYARERLEASGESAALRDRHLDYFVEAAKIIGEELEGAPVAEALERADADRTNFRLALEWAVASPENAPKGLRIAAALTRYWEIRGNLEEARDAFEEILGAPGAGEPSLDRARALACSGRIAWCQDRTANAHQRYLEASAMFTNLGDATSPALINAFLGFIARNAGRPDEAAARFQEAIETARATQNVLLTAIALSGLGSLAGDRGEIAAGRRLKEESLAIYRSVGDRWVTGYLLWGVAKICALDSDAASARLAVDEWVATARDLKNRWVLPHVLHVFGDILLIEENARAAARVLGAAEAGREALGITLDPADQSELDQSRDRLAGALDPAVLKREWELGRQMTIWEAVTFAQRPAVTEVAA